MATTTTAKLTVPLIEGERALIDRMTTPSPEVRQAVSQIDDDLMILGVSGKMGPTLAELLVRAGARRRVLGVARFSDPAQRDALEAAGVRTIKCDLLDDSALNALPDAGHIFLMAGFKFGATGNEALAWAMNTLVPAKVMQRFPKAKVVYVSSGNVYRFARVDQGGAREGDPLEPIGEYAQSRLGGERMVQFYASRNGTPAVIVRLFYATELRYGIILDIATKVWGRRPIDLAMGYVNQIWQGDANASLARAFPLCESPARVINLTGGEILSVREVAQRLGAIMGVTPIFEGRESETALLGDATECLKAFGPPSVPPATLVEWVAHWVMRGGATLNKPTKYESRTGTF
ncbi:NAD(P)-dependent oxidoreductase [bacterium]|nr:NAD(P)-dependent oxidoreductase [bacterium]